MVGRVVSVKMLKTVVVLVGSKKTHPMYGKTYVWSKKYLVDDQIGVSLGDVVVFDKIKPISKRKHWQISKVLGKDIVSLEQAELAADAAEAIAEVLPVEEEAPEENEKHVLKSEEKAEEIKEEKVVKKPRVKKVKAEETK